MKIVFVSADRGIPIFGNKGASIHIQELVSALAALGHQLTILTVRQGAPPCSLIADVIEVRADFSPSNEKGVLAEEQYSIRNSSAMFERLLALHRKEPFDLIYERYSLWSAAGVRAAHELQIPCAVEVNAPLLEEQRRYREIALIAEAQRIEREVFERADLLLPVSEQVKDYVLAKGADPARTCVVPNGVNPQKFHPVVVAEPLPEMNSNFVIGFAGSFKAWHGLDILLEAFKRLQNRSSSYHLLLAGDGPLRGWMEGYLQGAGLQGKVTMTGWVPHERLPGLIQRMDVAVAPYPFLENFYFSPLKLFEYMAIGKPIVASRMGQIQEVIQDGVTGLLARPSDIEDLVEKIEQCRRDPELRTTLRSAASQRALQYTWERTAHQILMLAEPLGRHR